MSSNSNSKLKDKLTCHTFDFSNFIDFNDEYESSLEEDNLSVQSDDSDAESVGNAVTTEVFDHYMVEYAIPTPKSDQPKAKRQRVVGTETLTPVTILVAGTVGCCKSQRVLRALLDSGSSRTLISKRVVPRNAKPKEINSKRFNTLAGQMTASKLVHMRDVRLPELNRNRGMRELKALVFNQPCRYDVILGSDFLNQAGLDIKYSEKQIEWFGDTIPLRTPSELTAESYLNMMEAAYPEDDVPDEEGIEDCYLSQILDAKYEAMDIKQVVSRQTHLTKEQQIGLEKVLLKYPQLFDGKLGVYPHRRFHIEVDPNAKPVARRPYPVADNQYETYKKELDHLVELGVLSVAGESEWQLPSFIVPKKDGRVRWISDLRELNKVIRRKIYPLPIIADVLRRRKGYKFFTKLDLSM